MCWSPCRVAIWPPNTARGGLKACPLAACLWAWTCSCTAHVLVHWPVAIVLQRIRSQSVVCHLFQLAPLSLQAYSYSWAVMWLICKTPRSTLTLTYTLLMLLVSKTLVSYGMCICITRYFHILQIAFYGVCLRRIIIREITGCMNLLRSTLLILSINVKATLVQHWIGGNSEIKLMCACDSLNSRWSSQVKSL